MKRKKIQIISWAEAIWHAVITALWETSLTCLKEKPLCHKEQESIQEELSQSINLIRLFNYSPFLILMALKKTNWPDFQISITRAALSRLFSEFLPVVLTRTSSVSPFMSYFFIFSQTQQVSRCCLLVLMSAVHWGLKDNVVWKHFTGFLCFFRSAPLQDVLSQNIRTWAITWNHTVCLSSSEQIRKSILCVIRLL